MSACSQLMDLVLYGEKGCLDVSVASYTQLNLNIAESVSILCGFRVSSISPNLTIGSFLILEMFFYKILIYILNGADYIYRFHLKVILVRTNSC